MYSRGSRVRNRTCKNRFVGLDNSSSIYLKTLKEVNEAKIAAVESYEKWHNKHKDTISINDCYLNSGDFETSPMENI